MIKKAMPISNGAGNHFIAHKMTTLYCSSSCVNKAYKAKKKQMMKEEVEQEQHSKLPIVESLGDKPYLSPMEAAKLLGVGKTTIYRYMAQGQFKVLRLPAKTLVRRIDLEAMFDNAPAYVKRNNHRHKIEHDS